MLRFLAPLQFTMKLSVALALAAMWSGLPCYGQSGSASDANELYFPPNNGQWEEIDPARAGRDYSKRNEALDFAGNEKSFGVVVLYQGRIFAEKHSVNQIPAESDLGPFLSKPQLDMQQIFSKERFPNLVVATDGSVVATWGSTKILSRRSVDGGSTWENPVKIAEPGFQGGGLTVDEKTGDILTFVESSHPPAPVSVYRSQDHGKSWTVQNNVVIHPDRDGNVPSMHMNEHGITLRHGKHAGRMVRATRWYAGKNDKSRWPKHYTNAIYSDDGGNNWQTSDPFPALGTGEATLAELSDGRIYYNSRRHWAPEGVDPLRRWTAISHDGGATWTDGKICPILPDGPQDTNYGCMAGLTRIPVAGRDVLIYSNCDSPKGRHHGTVWASFDGGQSWPIKRLVYEGSFAYSSLTSGRPKTASEGWIYLLFEGGPQGGATVARFNLSWLLEGKKTGDGAIPGWVAAAKSN